MPHITTLKYFSGSDNYDKGDRFSKGKFFGKNKKKDDANTPDTTQKQKSYEDYQTGFRFAKRQ